MAAHDSSPPKPNRRIPRSERYPIAIRKPRSSDPFAGKEMERTRFLKDIAAGETEEYACARAGITLAQLARWKKMGAAYDPRTGQPLWISLQADPSKYESMLNHCDAHAFHIEFQIARRESIKALEEQLIVHSEKSPVATIAMLRARDGTGKWGGKNRVLEDRRARAEAEAAEHKRDITKYGKKIARAKAKQAEREANETRGIAVFPPEMLASATPEEAMVVKAMMKRMRLVLASPQEAKSAVEEASAASERNEDMSALPGFLDEQAQRREQRKLDRIAEEQAEAEERERAIAEGRASGEGPATPTLIVAPLPESARICIVGGPRTGKTTHADKEAKRLEWPVLHTDDLIEKYAADDDGWSEVSEEVVTWLDRPGPWIIEGVRVVHGLRKWMRANAVGKPCDEVRCLWQKKVSYTNDGQGPLAKQVQNIFDRIRGELAGRGVVISEVG